MSKTYFQKRFWAQTILEKIIFQLSLQCSIDCFKHTHTHIHTHNGEASNCFYKASLTPIPNALRLYKKRKLYTHHIHKYRSGSPK